MGKNLTASQIHRMHVLSCVFLLLENIACENQAVNLEKAAAC